MVGVVLFVFGYVVCVWFLADYWWCCCILVGLLLGCCLLLVTGLVWFC